MSDERQEALNRLFLADALEQANFKISAIHTYAVPVSPKSLLETLCVAEFALQELGRQRPGYNAGGDIETHLEKVRELMAECQRKRPTGPGGKHDNLHTPECGCDTNDGVSHNG